MDLTIGSFDRTDEPSELKQLEGSTLEWGTEQVFSKAIAASQGANHTHPDEAMMPEVVYDEGDVGKEPMIRVLGHDPDEVVDKVIRIFNEWRRSTTDRRLSDSPPYEGEGRGEH